MSTQSWSIIGILAALVVAFAIGLGTAIAMAIAMDGDGMHNDGNPFSGMSGAMHDGNMADMISHMKEVMSDEDFAAMQAHMQSHMDGSPMMNDSSMDGVMHRMMDGMMEAMTDGYHHASPTPKP